MTHERTTGNKNQPRDAAIEALKADGRDIIVIFGGDYDDHHGLHTAGQLIVRDLQRDGLTARYVDCNRAGGLEWVTTKTDAVVWIIDPYRNTYLDGIPTTTNLHDTLTSAGLTVVVQSARCAEQTRNKQHTKHTARAAGLHTLDDVAVTTPATRDQAVELLATAGVVIVKPVDGSEGRFVAKVETTSHLHTAIGEIDDAGSVPLVEPYVTGPELSIPIVAMTRTPAVALPATEIHTDGVVFDRHAKNTTNYQLHCPPTTIDASTLQTATSHAIALADAMTAVGPIRVDFIINDNTPIFLEANSFPGLAPTGRLAHALSVHGWSIGNLAAVVIADQLPAHDTPSQRM